ncbi:hypothetical protein ACFFRE_06265 [Aciditerrimonas ferrireducens]|uniref:Uncharacterized protein n=1 Tax=Aciditerrimonas ferrireducens TaxID=667306 RepID=A0ABV6C661_9ACTN|nr:hypothetical protein [Aciditerrimonas ferrireducens]MCK4176621.1 hypothetical protein [Aciditerrimonas ferrireducens]
MVRDRVLRLAGDWARRRAREGEPWWLVVAVLLWAVGRQSRRGDLLWRGRVAEGQRLEVRVRPAGGGEPGRPARG